MSFSNTRRVKATRKTCRCYWCSEVIEIGQSKVYCTWMSDGFNQASFHPECDKANERWWKENPHVHPDDDCDHYGRMKRGTTEEN